MKSPVLLCLLGLALAACKKTDSAPDTASVATGFDQGFSLRYQQQAVLPKTGVPELTVTLADLDYTYCPPNAACALGTSVSPKFSVADAQGQTQQLALPLPRGYSYNAAWLDTTSIRANSRRYLVYYHKWHISSPADGRSPTKKDISVTLRVRRP